MFNKNLDQISPAVLTFLNKKHPDKVLKISLEDLLKEIDDLISFSV